MKHYPKRFNNDEKPWYQHHALIIAFVAQTLTAIWWIAKLDAQVFAQEQWINQHHNLSDTVCRLEERIASLHEEVNELEVRRG